MVDFPASYVSWSRSVTKLGSMVSKWVISPTYQWGIPWGYNSLILTIDPNFLKHPRTSPHPPQIDLKSHTTHGSSRFTCTVLAAEHRWVPPVPKVESSPWYGCIQKIVGFPPKSSILLGFSIINHPFWGTTIFGNTYISCKDTALMEKGNPLHPPKLDLQYQVQ